MAKKNTERKASRRWTVEEAGKILDEIEALGVSDSRYSRQRGLKVGRIAWWRKQLGRQRRVRHDQVEQKQLVKGAEQVSAFVEIKTTRDVSTETRIEVRLRNERSVLLPMGVPTEDLAVLLDVIEDLAC